MLICNILALLDYMSANGLPFHSNCFGWTRMLLWSLLMYRICGVFFINNSFHAFKCLLHSAICFHSNLLELFDRGFCFGYMFVNFCKYPEWFFYLVSEMDVFCCSHLITSSRDQHYQIVKKL